MDVVICGAGEVGRHSAEVLSANGHNITIIDQDPRKLAAIDQTMDVRLLEGSGAEASILRQGNVHKADLFIAATNIDEVNLLAASAAKGVGAGKTIARVHHSPYYDRKDLDYAYHLGINHLVCPEFETARAIAATIRSPAATAVENFATGKIQLKSLPVAKDAKAAGKSLVELKLDGARIAAVQREGTAFLPVASTTIQVGDVVTVIGEAKGFEKVQKLFGAEHARKRKVIIMGGSTQSVWLCREMHNRQTSVRLFVAREHRAQELSEKIDWVTVINADVIQTDVLREEHIEQADAFIASADAEETNILAAARAKTMGVANAICILQRGTYLHLLEHIGIDHSFSPRTSAVEQIVRLIEPGNVHGLGPLAQGLAEVFEVRVTKAAKEIASTPLAELKLPEQCLVAAIQREDEAFVPGAMNQFKYGDTAIVIAPAQQAKALKKLFGDG
ncbi:MAG: Trk system potassium transporter TrkA [Planctomycetota bacterium]